MWKCGKVGTWEREEKIDTLQHPNTPTLAPIQAIPKI